MFLCDCGGLTETNHKSHFSIDVGECNELNLVSLEDSQKMITRLIERFRAESANGGHFEMRGAGTNEREIFVSIPGIIVFRLWLPVSGRVRNKDLADALYYMRESESGRKTQRARHYRKN